MTSTATMEIARCFSYDYLRRMTEAWTSASTAAEPCVGTPDSTGVGGVAPYHHSYSYDVTGNRKTETLHAVAGSDEVTREYRYPNPGQPQPHTLTSVVETTTAGDRLYEYEYDAKGNTVQRTEIGEEQDLTWDAEGHLASVTKAGQTTSFVYDADGNRLVRKEPNATTVYLMGMELRLDHVNQVVDGTRYYPVNGSLMVVRTVMGVQFQAADHHGTGQAAVDAVTGQLSYRRTTPFGSPRGAQPADGDWYGEKGFVGGTVDKSTGLTHLGAREYDSAIGRFISVDPIIDYGDPQQMHGFAYANNSPVSFTDPDGLKPLATGGGGAEEEKYWKDNDQKLVQNSAGQWTVISHVWPTPSEPAAVVDARADLERTKQEIMAVAEELGDILLEELGVKDGLDCLTTGDINACVATVITIVLAVVAAAAVKIFGKYAVKWEKGERLLNRLNDLGGRLKDLIGKYREKRKKYDDAVESCKTAPPNSFVPGTLVLLADGSTKPIEDVDVGDVVIAADPEAGLAAPKTVVATIVGHGTKHLVEITVDIDGDMGNAERTLIATGGHPFWMPELHEWLDAGELRVGQRLQTSAGTLVQISALRRSSENAQVHNLTVDDIHTYYVLAGDTPVLVHNSNDPTSGTIVSRGTMKIQIYANDHGPPHAHLKDGKVDIQIGQNGKPLNPDVKLNSRQQAFIDDNIKLIRSSIGAKMREYRLSGGGC